MSSYPLSTVLVLNLLAVVGFMGVAWLLSILTKNASLADIFWGLGFVLIAWLSFSLSGGYSGRRILITLLTSVWGLRLSIHILWRNWGKGEDRRYQAWRDKRGASFWWVSFFTVFLTQAILLWLVSLAVQVGQSSPIPSRLTALDVLGSLVWLIGFIFEAVADWQLARFKVDPANRGKVMDQGLWAYSRHPNYFGESLIWWGLCLIALASPGGWWALMSPVVITVLLLKVSGVVLLEKTIVERRPDYQQYLENTNAFIPWFPKRKKS